MTKTTDLIDGLQCDLKEGAITLDEVVIRFADEGRTQDIAALVAGRLALDPETVARALMARWQEAAAMLCRTAGLGANGYSAVLRLRRRAGRTLDAAPAPLLAAYLQRPRLSREALTEALNIYAAGATEARVGDQKSS